LASRSTLRPHAYDPATNPELFEGVLTRRVVAFIIDLIIIAIPLLAASMFIFVFGIVTFGIGWRCSGCFPPASVIWALALYGLTLGSPCVATIGMRAMDIDAHLVRRARYFMARRRSTAVVYWISVSVLTPFIVLVGIFKTHAAASA